MVAFRSIGLLALTVGNAWLVDAQVKVKIMALGDSITGSPVRKQAHTTPRYSRSTR
jgi:hypothetical protein